MTSKHWVLRLPSLKGQEEKEGKPQTDTSQVRGKPMSVVSWKLSEEADQEQGWLARSNATDASDASKKMRTESWPLGFSNIKVTGDFNSGFQGVVGAKLSGLGLRGKERRRIKKILLAVLSRSFAIEEQMQDGCWRKKWGQERDFFFYWRPNSMFAGWWKRQVERGNVII